MEAQNKVKLLSPAIIPLSLQNDALLPAPFAAEQFTAALVGFSLSATGSQCMFNVRFGSKADISACPRHVRFTPESGHGSARF